MAPVALVLPTSSWSKRASTGVWRGGAPAGAEAETAISADSPAWHDTRLSSRAPDTSSSLGPDRAAGCTSNGRTSQDSIWSGDRWICSPR